MRRVKKNTLTNAVDQLKQAQTTAMLNPEAKMLVEATFSAFDKFQAMTDQLRGGGVESNLHEGETKESDQIDFAGAKYDKYHRYWDDAEERHGYQKAYDADSGLIRDTTVSASLRQVAEKREQELKVKLTTPEATADDLSDYIATLYLHRFTEIARWTDKGKPIDQRQLH